MGAYLQITPALKTRLDYGEVRGCYYGPLGHIDHKEVTSESGEIFNCDIDHFDAERDLFPYPDEHFDTVLCCELIEHLSADPMHMMCEVNRILKPGGHLVLTTPNICCLRAISAILQGYHPGFFPAYIRPAADGADTGARHNREYAPRELAYLFRDSGFDLTLLDTGEFRDEPHPEHEWARHLLQTYKLRARTCAATASTRLASNTAPSAIATPPGCTVRSMPVVATVQLDPATRSSAITAPAGSAKARSSAIRSTTPNPEHSSSTRPVADSPQPTLEIPTPAGARPLPRLRLAARQEQLGLGMGAQRSHSCLIDVTVDHGQRNARRRNASPPSAAIRIRSPRPAARKAFTLPIETIWTNRSLIRSMVRRDIMARYRGSAGDLLWTVLNPLLLMATYFFVFGIVLQSTRSAPTPARPASCSTSSPECSPGSPSAKPSAARRTSFSSTATSSRS